MDPLEKVCRAIHARDLYRQDLDAVDDAFESLPWYKFIRRNSLQRDIESLNSKIDDCSQRISSEAVLDVAYLAGSQIWNGAALKLIPEKNQYGRAAEENFDEILEMTMKRRDEINIWVGSQSFELSKLTDVIEVLTKQFVKSNAQRIIAERLTVAASTDFMHRSFVDRDEKEAMIIQHVDSGLRALFTISDPGFGSVYSKPYKIRSIDPGNPGVAKNWEMYMGLGIGEQIYREAHRLMPEIRWRSGASSDYAHNLRRKLHARNPYIWSRSSCQWCSEKLRGLPIYSWEDADQEFFIDHP